MKIIALNGYKGSGKDAAANHLVNNKGFIKITIADPLKDKVAEDYNIPRSNLDDPKLKEAPILHLPVLPKGQYALKLSKMLYKEFRTEKGTQALDFHVDASGAFLGLIPSYSLTFGRNEYAPAQLYWTPRALMIMEGHSKRAVDPNYWIQTTVDLVENTIAKVKTAAPGLQHLVSDKVVISDLRLKVEVDQLKQAFGKNLITVRINRFDSVNSTDVSENELTDHKFDIIIDNKGTLEEFLQKVSELV